MKKVIPEPSESKFYDMEQSHVVVDIEEEYVYSTDVHLDTKEEFELWRAIEESSMQVESEEQRHSDQLHLPLEHVRKTPCHVYSNFLELYVIYIEVLHDFDRIEHLVNIMGGILLLEYDPSYVTHVLVDSTDA